MQFSDRQKKIIEIIKDKGPITGTEIAELLHLTRATLRPDLSILIKVGMIDGKPKVGYIYKGQMEIPSINIHEIKVQDVKSEAITVSEDTSIYQAVILLFLKDCGTIYVTDSDRNLVGVLSRKDIIKSAVGGNDPNQIPVGMIMTRMPNIHSVTDEDSVYTAALRMMEHEIDSLPVVRGEEQKKEILEITGRISKTTITKLFVQLIKAQYETNN